MSRGSVSRASKRGVLALAFAAGLVAGTHAAMAQVYIDQTDTGTNGRREARPAQQPGPGLGEVLQYFNDPSVPQAIRQAVPGVNEMTGTPSTNKAFSVQTGLGNAATIESIGAGNLAQQLQIGNGNTTTQTQIGDSHASTVTAVGNQNAVGTVQNGDRNNASVTVLGANNTVGTSQTGTGLGVTVTTVGDGKTISVNQVR